jgi:hypothetical protein
MADVAAILTCRARRAPTSVVRGAASLGLVTLILGCQEKQMTATEANRSFVATMLGEKKRLEDFPDRVDPNIVMHEPASLPFGGTYRGLADFQRFYPEVRRFYDFERFELLGVYADGDTVFATIRLGIAHSPAFMYLAEQFKFSGTKLIEVRVHICDPVVPAALDGGPDGSSRER